MSGMDAGGKENKNPTKDVGKKNTFSTLKFGRPHQAAVTQTSTRFVTEN